MTSFDHMSIATPGPNVEPSTVRRMIEPSACIVYNVEPTANEPRTVRHGTVPARTTEFEGAPVADTWRWTTSSWVPNVPPGVTSRRMISMPLTNGLFAAP